MNLNDLEYSLMMRSCLIRTSSDDNSVPISELISLLVITVLAAVGQLVLSQMTHCITLLTLVHQNIYNVLTLIVSVMTHWKSQDSLQEEVKGTHSYHHLVFTSILRKRKLLKLLNVRLSSFLIY